LSTDFDLTLSIADIIIPSFSLGIIITGIVFYLYLYIKEKNNGHLCIVFLAISILIFVLSELLITVIGGISHNFRLSVEFHRIEQIAGAFMIFLFMRYISLIVKLKNGPAKFLRFYLVFLFVSSFLFLILAYVTPDLFISLNKQQQNNLYYEGAFGRGAEGPLIIARDIILLISIIYAVVILIIDTVRKKSKREHLLPFIGIFFVVYLTSIDVIFVYTQFHIDFIQNPFSRTTVGVSVLLIALITSALSKYISRSLNVKEAYRQLNTANEMFELISGKINEVFWMTNADVSEIKFISHAFEQQWGIDKESIYVFPQGWINSVYHEDLDEVYDIFKSNDPLSRSLLEYRIRKLDGTIAWIRDRWFPVYERNKTLSGWIRVTEDITEYKSTQTALSYISYHDKLTSLPNRQAFYEKFEDAIAQAERSDTEKTRVIFFMDLNKFKDVNETLGYEVGDQLLKDVAIRIKDCLRKTDYFFRVGGDEFAVVLNKLNKETDAVWVAEKINSEIGKPFRINGNDIYIGISIGICIYPDNGKNIDVLLQNVDTALNQAKREKVKYIFYDKTMNENMLKRKNIENKLRKAIENQELNLYYQPFVNENREIVGMEALIRWHNKDLGNVPPMDFIYIAEDNGFIVDIGNWVLEQACSDIKDFIAVSNNNIKVAVNLSAYQFRQTNLIEKVLYFTNMHSIAPSNIELEITESCAMDNPLQTIEIMNKLKEKGFNFSIDDFGTGYSSLSYIVKFPVAKLKIDRSFVKDLFIADKFREIATVIINMAHNLNFEVTAEGVETPEQMQLLLERGCDYMQGFLFSKAVAKEEMLDLLSKKNI